MPCRLARSRTSNQRVLDGVRQVERRHFQFHAPGFDLREIENVVDQRKQMAPGGKYVVDVFACFSFNSPNSLSCNTSENPMIALSGVRSSWDTLARNSDF